MINNENYQKIVIKTEYITLGSFLKFTNWISNGSDAKIFLLKEKIFVNDILENRRGRKLYPGNFVKVKNNLFLIIKKEE